MLDMIENTEKKTASQTTDKKRLESESAETEIKPTPSADNDKQAIEFSESEKHKIQYLALSQDMQMYSVYLFSLNLFKNNKKLQKSNLIRNIVKKTYKIILQKKFSSKIRIDDQFVQKLLSKFKKK